MNAPLGLPGRGAIQRYEAREALGFLPRGWIDGGALSNDTTDATNDIGIAACSARSTVNIVDGSPSTLTRDQIDLDLPIAIIKQLDVAFAPENYSIRGYSGGDRSGGRSSSATSNTSWHAILAGGMGLQPDVFFHDSATQANILAEMQKIGGYTAYRHIMSIVRTGGAIKAFKQYAGGRVRWAAAVNESLGSFFSTTQTNYTLTGVPSGIEGLLADVSVWGSSTNGNSLFSMNVGHPDETLVQPTDTATVPTALTSSQANVANRPSFVNGLFPVNATPAIAVRGNLTATGNNIATFGFVHPRGRDA